MAVRSEANMARFGGSVGTADKPKETDKENTSNNVEKNNNVPIVSENQGCALMQNQEQKKLNIFEDIFERYKITYDIDLIVKITGKTKDEILNSDEAIKQNIKQCLERAFEKHKNILNKKNGLNTVAETAKKYYIALSSGLSIDKFEEAQKNNKSESIKNEIIDFAKSKNKDFDIKTASREELKSYVLEYFSNSCISFSIIVSHPIISIS